MKIEESPAAGGDKFFSVYDIGVQYGGCSLKDYCSPNPCQHGGRCNQTEDNIVCNCRDTLYEGSTCHRGKHAYIWDRLAQEPILDKLGNGTGS